MLVGGRAHVACQGPVLRGQRQMGRSVGAMCVDLGGEAKRWVSAWMTLQPCIDFWYINND
jgi:hypothetical protein